MQCPVPGPPRCPPAPRNGRKVGGLGGDLTPCCCLSPLQGLPAAMGHRPPLYPHNQPRCRPPPASPSCPHPPSSPSPAPPASTWGPSPAPCPTPCPPSPRSAPTALPRPPPSATGSSDNVGHPPPAPGPPTQPAAEGTETQSWGRVTRTALLLPRRGRGGCCSRTPIIPPGPGGLGEGGNLALPSTPQPSSPQQGMGLGPADAPSPPASIWHSYSQVLGAKAKGHSLYPAPT